MRDSYEYSLNPKKGIYYTENIYHDDVEYHYVVDFDKPDVPKQFQSFLKNIEANGKKAAMRDLKQQFKGLRELLA
jgi:hypothetical protein